MDLEGSDPDNDSLRFEASNLPAGAVFNVANNRAFIWTPSNTQGGQDYLVTFRVLDLNRNRQLKGGSDVKTIVITVNDNLEPIGPISEKAKIKRHVLNVKNIIVNDWGTVKKGESFDIDVIVENKGNVKENDVVITLNIPQLDHYERSNKFDIKKKKTETRSFSVIIPEEINDDVVYAIVTVSSNKDEVSEMIGFLVE